MALLLLVSTLPLLGLASSQSSTAVPTPYQKLPPPPGYADGTFTNPNTATTQIFPEGSSLNITWTTKYTAINLYLITNGEYNSPTGVVSVYQGRWYNYTLNCTQNNCSVPYNFRAVDAYGNQGDQDNGGFATGQFWIQPSANSQTTSASASSTSHSSTSTSSTATSTSTGVAPTGSPGSSSGSNNATAIGVGVGVGVGAALLIVAAAGFLWRRRQRKIASPAGLPEHNFSPSYQGVQSPDWAAGGTSVAYDTQPYSDKQPDPQSISEAPDTGRPVEAPTNIPPQELPADSDHLR